jgi:alkanesulfonate monooxygenase SsuD/methylene tetrahydromethanopterin reductase-like flavin-dependent oxidoreductase (luciferase family)
MTGVIVLPMRDPILLAKQAATLDRFSHGRLILGVGVGAYREEMEATYPDRREAPRAEWMDESIQALRLLASERRVDFEGRWIRFRDVEMYPKPAQDPLPIYSAGNADGSIRRAATWCQGWIPAAIGPTRVAEGRARLRAYAVEAGRDPDAIEIAPQLVACIGRTTEEAEARFRGSQVYEHLVSLQASTLKGFDVSSYVSMNLIGSVTEVVERVERYREAGADHLSGLLFVGDTLEALREQVATFATEVMPRFRD